MTKKEKWLLAILAAINFTHIMDFMIMMPLQEYLSPIFNITPKEFSFLVASYGLSAGFASITASFFVDRFDRKKVLLFGYSGFIIGTLACAFAPSYLFLMLARITAGLFGGLIGAQVLSIVGDTFQYERRGAAMGTLMGAFALAAIAGVPGGLFLANSFNWHFPFIGIGGLALIVLPLAIRFISSMTSHISNIPHNRFAIYQAIAKNRNMQLGLLMMFSLIMAHFSIIPFLAPYMEKNVGFTRNDIATMYFVGGICSFIFSPLIGRAADKFGKQKIMSIFLVLSAIPVYLITTIGPSPIWLAIVICCLFFILGGGRMIPAQALITSVVSPQLRGSFMNINAALQQIGTALTSLIAGVIVSKDSSGKLMHYEVVGYIGIALSFFCLLIMLKVKVSDPGKAN